MSNPSSQTAPVAAPSRPYPWFCPRCRQKKVVPVVLAYECERRHNGQAVTVGVPRLAAPRCGNCGELVFTYDVEEQINAAFLAQTSGSRNGPPPT